MHLPKASYWVPTEQKTLEGKKMLYPKGNKKKQE
jgi:hypothetical protein